MFVVSARPGKVKQYFTIQPIRFFAKPRESTALSPILHSENQVSSGVPKAAHLYFPVILASVKCLSAFPQAPVYFLPHFAVGTPFLPAENKLPPPRPLSSPPSPLSPTLKPVLSAHDDQVANCRGCWWSIDCGSLPLGRKYLFHFSSLLFAYNLHPLALQI